MTSRFVAVEGIDGSGKSTLVKALAKELYRPTLSFPSGEWTGRLIRSLLSDPAVDARTRTMAALFAADFREFSLGPLTWLRNVVVDRYVHSSLAYNCATPADEEFVRRVNEGLPKPSLTIWLDAPVSDCLSRLRNRGRLDSTERADALARARERYAALVDDAEWPVVRIDASRSPSEVLAEAMELVVAS